MEIRTTNSALTKDYVNAITVRGGGHSLAGTLVGPAAEQRLVLIDDHAVYVPPADHLLVIRNDDVPGIIGVVGGVLGDAGININQLQVGQSERGVGAVMALVTEVSVPIEVQDRLRAHDSIISVRAIDLA